MLFVVIFDAGKNSAGKAVHTNGAGERHTQNGAGKKRRRGKTAQERTAQEALQNL